MTRQERIVHSISRLVSKGLFAEAQQALAAALERYPDNGALWLLRGVADYRRADFDQARRAFEHAGLLVPLDARTQCLLADAYARTGYRQQAHSLLKLLADEPNLGLDVLPLLAAGFGHLGDYQNSLTQCDRAADLDPRSPEAHFGVAYYLRRLGYPAGLILPPLTRAFKLAPDNLLYRSNLAFLLAELGRQDEAYDLLRDVPLEAWSCTCGLRRMKSLYQAVGDFARWQQCAQRLHEMGG